MIKGGIAPLMLVVMLVMGWIVYIAFSPSYDDRVPGPAPSYSVYPQSSPDTEVSDENN